MKSRTPKCNNSSELFKMVFWIVLSLTIISILIPTLIAFCYPTPSQLQISLSDTCTTTWKMGFGAILGLISAKANEVSNSK